MSEEPQRKTLIEQIEVAGDQLLEQIKNLIHEGNVRRIRIKHDGREVLEIPVTLAVVGGLIAPQVAALAAFAAAVTRCSVEVIREVPEATPEMLPAERPAAEALPAAPPSAEEAPPPASSPS